MTPAIWPAPAKLNLMLRVVGRRPDGYHLLQTVFQFIDLCDEIRCELRRDGIVRRIGGPPGIPHDSDLVVRAAWALQAETGCGLGADIHLHKRIPLGAGLGGGSSDAATALVALNRLWDCGLDASRLMAVGLRLGADVPIFVHGESAWAEGVGERLAPIAPAAPVYAVLVPPVHVDTGTVFQDPELTRNSARITIADFVAGERGNDCLAVVRKRYPQVAAVYDWLAQRADARLTGTGGSVFAEVADRDAGEALVAERPRDTLGFVVRGLNRSPLHATV